MTVARTIAKLSKPDQIIYSLEKKVGWSRCCSEFVPPLPSFHHPHSQYSLFWRRVWINSKVEHEEFMTEFEWSLWTVWIGRFAALSSLWCEKEISYSQELTSNGSHEPWGLLFKKGYYLRLSIGHGHMASRVVHWIVTDLAQPNLSDERHPSQIHTENFVSGPFWRKFSKAIEAAEIAEY